MDPTAAARPLALSRWLFIVAGLVFAMVVVGGITRLTESGLSITEWKPVSGAIPPLSQDDWRRAFELYQQTPEYRLVNGPAGMDLAGFKFIFFWEWVHRLLGRVIGLAFALPLAWFAVKRAIPKGYGPRLVALLLVGGAQGALGWYMVVSGLSERTDVSHLRLSAHLLLALFLLAALLGTALDLRRLALAGGRPARLTFATATTGTILFVQLLLGAWVAGLNAGYVASDWPLMQGKLYPDGIDWSLGVVHALTNDPFLLHFLHRWWAFVVVAALVVFARKIRPIEPKASKAIHIAFGTQILLGIATVMTGMNIMLAVLHQAVGALVVGAFTWGANVHGRRNA